MTLLKAFVARSFDPGDEQRIRPVLDHLDTFQKAGFFWETAEAAEVEAVSKKVRRMIDERDIFIGFFTKRYPVYSFTSKINGALQVLFGNTKPQSWSAPAWVLQESGYALHGGKKLILLREADVAVPGLQGDLEYVPFDPHNPAAVFSKLNEMIHGLLAEAAGITVATIVTQRHEQTQVVTEDTVTPVSAEPNEVREGIELETRYIQMVNAADKHDLEAVAEAWRAGNELIANGKDEGMDQVSWDSLYLANRFAAGATDAIEDLKRLRDQNPDRFDPRRAMASCYYKSKEFDLAAPLYLEVANAQEGEKRAQNLIMAAKALRETSRYQEAIEATTGALSILPDDLQDEAILLHYQLLKEQGEDYLAFATAEAALHENPQLSVRFSLGLDYRLKDLNEIAFFHFKFLHDRNSDDSSALHNFALLSADSKLPIAAVERYKRAIVLGETLSAANLGYMYLDCGMAEHAKTVISEAMATEDHAPLVEKCLAEITERREREHDKEIQLLKEAAISRRLFLDMGRALCAPEPSIDGPWKFLFGMMTLSVTSGNVYGSADLKRQENPFGLILSGIGGEQAVKVDTYILSGRLRGGVCKFQLSIGEKGERGIMGVIPRVHKSGFIIFASDGKSATYAELSDSKLGKPEIIKRDVQLIKDLGSVLGTGMSM